MNAPDQALSFKSFEAQILYFNGMYRLPTAPYPTLSAVVAHEKEMAAKQNITIKSGREAIARRLLSFRKTLIDELNEVDEILSKMNRGFEDDGKEYMPEDMLTDLADWFTDLQVYCASEQAKFGIPVRDSQNIVMASNFSKLGPDGQPIYDDNGKVLKGPGYWKPEPQLKAMIQERIAENTPIPEEGGIVWRY